MFELIIILLFCWLFFQALGLTFRIAWGVTKFMVSVLFTVAVTTLVWGLLFAGGLLLLIPLALVSIAFGLLKRCV